MRKREEQEKLKYFIYLRRSSENEDKQVQSIADQNKVLEKIAEQQNLEVVGKFSESCSAKEPGRPEFNQMVQRIKKGEANGILVWKLNRLARNPVDGGSISWMLQQEDIKNIKTCDRNYYPDDNVLMMAVELGMANQYIRDLSTDTLRGIRAREEKGYPSGVAPMGFTNDLMQERGNRGWLVDKERFPLVKQLLERYSTGKYSIRKITEIANEEMGLRTVMHRRQGGKKLVISYIALNILRNPVYAGFFFNKDNTRFELHSSLPRMITEDKYWEIQEILGSKGRPRLSVNKETFAYVGPIKCGGCGGSVTAEHKYQIICPECRFKFSSQNKVKCPRCGTKIDDMENPTRLHYIYYHCTKKIDRTCKEGSVQEIHVDDYLASYFKQNLKISPSLRDWCVENLDQLERGDSQNEFEKKANLEKTLSEREKELRELNIMKMREHVNEEEYSDIKSYLKGQTEALKKELSKLGHVDPERIKVVQRAFDLATGLDEIFRNGSALEKKEALSEIGSNLSLKEKKLNVFNNNVYGRIINGLLEAKKKNERFEPENCEVNKDKTEVFASVCPTLLALLNDFRTFDWAEEYKYPTVVLDQMKGLLAKYENL